MLGFCRLDAISLQHSRPARVLHSLMGLVLCAASAQYIQSMLLQRGSQTALLPLPVDIGLTAAAKLGSSMLLFGITFTGERCTAALSLSLFSFAMPSCLPLQQAQHSQSGLASQRGCVSFAFGNSPCEGWV
jgi:hypothetical protein